MPTRPQQFPTDPANLLVLLAPFVTSNRHPVTSNLCPLTSNDLSSGALLLTCFSLLVSQDVGARVRSHDLRLHNPALSPLDHSSSRQTLPTSSPYSDFSNKRSAMLIRFSGFGAPPARLFLQGVSTCLLCILHDTLIRFCDFPPPHATLTFDTLI